MPQNDLTRLEITFPHGNLELFFTQPLEILTAWRVDQVAGVLARIDAALARGDYAAGYLAYEAAPAFDPAMDVHTPGEMPLACFGIYAGRRELAANAVAENVPVGADVPTKPAWRVGEWRALVSRGAYLVALERIRSLIGAGATYQVNYTFPLEASFSGEARPWFEVLCAAQGSGYPAFLDMGRWKVLSISPELFFRLNNAGLTMRPMKGTRPRGRWATEDNQCAAQLRASAKDRAENIMIVDMIRNDLGRISETGTVQVVSHFDLERRPTVWQMTSTVVSRTTKGIAAIFEALFPAASVTGAPRIETMRVIRQLEQHPRGVYCGAIGWCAPDGTAEFSVGIRTVVIDASAGIARYHVGSGVTWDSRADDEYDECLHKARVLTHRMPAFELLETLLCEDGQLYLLDRHLKRLGDSAAYFDFVFNMDRVGALLLDSAHKLRQGKNRIRLRLAKNGSVQIETTGYAPPQRLRIGLSAVSVNASDSLLFHKTTHRDIYQRARESRPDCDDVLLWNERDEVTETSIGNILMELDGRLVTPALECGLLPGTYRQELLDAGTICEGVIRKSDINVSARLWVINSLMRTCEATLI